MLKYGIYGAAGLWMFALGVMVGRGTAPVSFDTRGFQARLEAIALEYGRQEKKQEKVDLKFYDALNQPVQHEVRGRKRTSGEIVPSRERTMAADVRPAEAGVEDDVPVKTGKKQASINRDLMAKKPVSQSQTEAPKAGGETVKSRKTAVLKKPKAAEPDGNAPARKTAAAAAAPEKTGRYTIQVAAYKAFKDAVSQMAALEKKGIPSYRIKGEKDGAVWYRVRTGSFADYQAAKSRLRELEQAKVDGMIIKKE